MRRILGGLLAALFICVGSAWGQATRFTNTALKPTAGIPGATVRVCTETASGTPCAPLASIYTDKALTQLDADSTITADSLGNFGFYALAGCYKWQISAPLFSTTTETVCNGGGGGGGTPGGTNKQFQFNNAGSFGGGTPSYDPILGTSDFPNDLNTGSGNPNFNVKAAVFGALCNEPGNGSGADDTAAFVSSLTAMHSSFGGILYAPKSSFACKVAGASLDFSPGGANGSWSYSLMDNGLYLTSSIAPATDKVAFVGRRGTAFGLSGSESNPSVNFATSGNFPAFTIGQPTTGTYLEGIGLVEKTGGNTACNFKITSDASHGGPVQLELNHIMFLTLGTGGNVCATPLVPGDSTGNSLYIHNSYLQTQTSATPTINLVNHQLVKLNNLFLRAGGIVFGNEVSYNQCSGLQVSDVLTESLTNTSFLTINSLGSKCGNISVANVESADPVGSVYLFKVNGLGASQLVVRGGIRNGGFTGLVDPASTALLPNRAVFLAEPGTFPIKASLYQSGWLNNGEPMPTILGRHVASNWAFSPVTPRYTSIAMQGPTGGANQINLSGCTGCTAVATTDPFGGNNAVLISTSSGSNQAAYLFFVGSFPGLVTGDYVAATIWVRTPNGTGFDANGSPVINLGGSNTFLDSATAQIAMSGATDGRWSPTYTIGTVTGTFTNGNVSFKVNVDSSHPVAVYEPDLYRIPAATPAEEAYLYAMYAQTWPKDAVVGSASLHLGQSLTTLFPLFSAKTFWRGPISGGAALPTIGNIVLSDLAAFLHGSGGELATISGTTPDGNCPTFSGNTLVDGGICLNAAAFMAKTPATAQITQPSTDVPWAKHSCNAGATANQEEWYAADGVTLIFAIGCGVGPAQLPVQAAPGTVTASQVWTWADSTDKRLHDKNDAGVIGTTVVAHAAVTNEYVTSISAAGAVATARPTCGNLSDSGTGCTATLAAVATSGSATDLSTGALPAGRMPALTGAVTSSAGAVATSPGKVDVGTSNEFCLDAGANDTYACNLSPAITAYVTGTHYRFKANTLNTNAASINFNGVGALTIKKVAGGITTDLATNDILAGQWVDLVYDGTNMQMQSLLGNAPAAGTQTIASGAKALATGAIASATCTTAQTDTATGTATTDAIITTFNGDPTAVTGYVPLTTGMLTIIAYPTTNTVNFKVCNNTTASITPGAITLNWRVVR